MGWWKRRRTRQREAVLAAVHMAPGATAQEIQSIAHVSWHAVGVHLAELRRDGLVTRYWTGDPFAGYTTVRLVWVPLEAADVHDDEQDGDGVTFQAWRSHQ